MLAPGASAPRVTRFRLGKYWSRDFFQKEAESSRQGVDNPEPHLFSLPLSRSDRLPRRWGQQAARLGYTGYLWLNLGGSEIWWCMHSAHSLSSYSQVISQRLETRKQEEILFSLRIVPSGLQVAEAPTTSLHNATHLYSNQANPLMGVQQRLENTTSHLKVKHLLKKIERKYELQT